ncbi:hypothetical protein [Lentibacillus amyloliquefaciens]|uniref:Uncharacterized protein n=1 Tax=Lentibacillus amyloliquefaciens TaxID=1472767 RepID=A0A0U3WBY9_9BACI|nr:hypothetical protein [Lentibacillus amyloliquefaciens]ALX50450.1 hypothetical protein AOX59_18810 [Lentibacillus amyloliquefaciens]
MTRKQKEWAFYKGDEFRFMGTTRECAEFLGSSEESVRYYATTAYQRKLAKRKTIDNSTITVDVSGVV